MSHPSLQVFEKTVSTKPVCPPKIDLILPPSNLQSLLLPFKNQQSSIINRQSPFSRRAAAPPSTCLGKPADAGIRIRATFATHHRPRAGHSISRGWIEKAQKNRSSSSSLAGVGTCSPSRLPRVVGSWPPVTVSGRITDSRNPKPRPMAD